jgi:catechol 2,3-dioxygenase-like lactoylglutathione lyase family enzyme
VFDHVTLRVLDLEEARRFYATALEPLGYDEPATDGRFYEWGDLSVSLAGADRPVTRHVHVAVSASSREQVGAFWRAATGAGYRDNGPPGLRPAYHEGYYGAFVLDPAGNNIEAVHHGFETGGGMIDHVDLRVRDLAASRCFYEAVLEPLGRGVWAEGDQPDGDPWVDLGRRGGSLWLGAGEPSENVHLAFAAADNATVDEFHRVAIAAGYPDNGPPGERRYHPGYYGAFVLDPDGNNIEAVCHNR